MLESIAEQVIAGAVLLVLGVVIGALVPPLKWPLRNRQLKTMLAAGRTFLFVFNPEANLRKTVTFLPNGDIGVGRNDNEHKWRVRRGLLEILASDGALYSRFSYEPVTGRLVNTNEPGVTRSIHGQYLQVQYVPWREDQGSTRETEPPTVKWVDLKYPADTGLEARFKANGFLLAWCAESKLRRRVELEGAQIAVDLTDAGPVMFKVRSQPADLVLIATRAPSGRPLA